MQGRLLITGGSGLLALNWAAACRDHRPVTLALHRRRVALAGVETYAGALGTAADAAAMLDATRPAIVIHAAGLTSVEACEADPTHARHVNVTIADVVARACAARGIGLVHISTDHLFAGDAPMTPESAPVHPLNAYARTKAEAETAVAAAHPGALIARTNFFGWGTPYRRSFSDTILQSLSAGRRLTLFADVFFTPILAADLARAALDLIGAGASGIVHIAGDERLSKHDFGVRLANAFGLDTSLIDSGRLRDATGLAPRPHDMSLSNALARGVLGRPLGGVDAQFAVLREQERTGLAEELKHL